MNSKIFSSQIDVKELDSLGGVQSLNKALFDVLEQSSHWMNTVCN